MVFIIAAAFIIYFILIAWTWHSLGFIEKGKKVAIIILGMIFMYLITLVIFQMAKSGVTYENKEIQGSVQNILVAIFTGVNGIIVMPQVGKMLDKMNENQIEKDKFMKRILILVVVFAVCAIFEVTYMKETQDGILRVYKSNANVANGDGPFWV